MEEFERSRRIYELRSSRTRTDPFTRPPTGLAKANSRFHFPCRRVIKSAASSSPKPIKRERESPCLQTLVSLSTKVESYSRPSRNALMAANRKFREVASGMACSTSSVPVPGIVVTRVASLPVGVSEPRNLSASQCFALSSKCPSAEPPSK